MKSCDPPQPSSSYNPSELYPSSVNWKSKTGTLQSYFPGDASGKESTCNSGEAKDVGSIPRSGRSPGEGNGNPPQHSCLEDSMDRGAWQAIVCGVTKSQTGLSTLQQTRRRLEHEWMMFEAHRRPSQWTQVSHLTAQVTALQRVVSEQLWVILQWRCPLQRCSLTSSPGSSQAHRVRIWAKGTLRQGGKSLWGPLRGALPLGCFVFSRTLPEGGICIFVKGLGTRLGDEYINPLIWDMRLVV